MVLVVDATVRQINKSIVNCDTIASNYLDLCWILYLNYSFPWFFIEKESQRAISFSLRAI